MSDSSIDMTPPDIRARAAIANDCVIPEYNKYVTLFIGCSYIWSLWRMQTRRAHKCISKRYRNTWGHTSCQNTKYKK